MMKKFSGILFFCFLLVTIFYSCTNSNDLTIGSNFIQSDASLVSTDTFSVGFSTLILDSIKTSGTNVALVGRYVDKNIGALNSRSYVIFGTGTSTLDVNAVFDSLVLVLVPSGYYYGDTSAFYNLKIHRVTQTIEVPDDDFLSNNSSFEFDPDPIGSKFFIPKPNSGDEIRIPIKNSLGAQMASRLKSSSNPFEDEGGFTGYFKGVFLQTDESTNSILGFSISDTAMSLKMYYHISGYDETQTLSITPYATSLQFNQIKADSTNSVISKLSELPISSEQLNNNAFVQGGTGIVARIDFPTLKNLGLQDRRFEVVKAELIIQPSLEMDLNYLPSNLYLYLSNKHNDFITQLTDSDGKTVTGTLNEDYIFRENTSYSWDITSFVSVYLNQPELGYNGLLLLPDEYDRKFNHVIVANQQKSKFRSRLKLYILYYE